jgi:hypothetical protein
MTRHPTRALLLASLALLTPACSGNKDTPADAGPVDAGLVDAGPPDGGVGCLPYPTPGPLRLYAVRQGDQAALAWVPGADVAGVAHFQLSVFGAATDAACLASAQLAATDRATLLDHVGTGQVARVLGLQADGRLKSAVPDGGGLPEFFISDVASLAGGDGGWTAKPLSADVLDGFAPFGIDTARQVVVGRSGTTLRILRTDSRGASWVATDHGSQVGPVRAAYDAAHHTVYACYVEAGTGAVKLTVATDDGATVAATDQTVSGGVLTAIDGTCDVAVAGGVVAVIFDKVGHTGFAVSTSADQFAHAVTVATTTTGLAYSPSLAYDPKGQRLVAAFDMPRVGKVAGKSDVQAATSADLGLTWSAPGVVTDAVLTNADVKGSRLVVDGVNGRYYVLYSNVTTRLSSFGISTDQGSTWVGGDQLGNDLGTTTYAEGPSGAVAAGGKVWFGFQVSGASGRQAYVQVWDPDAVVGTVHGALGASRALPGLARSGTQTGPAIAFDPYLSTYLTWLADDNTPQVVSTP